jgi:general secretion pathway protein G
MKAKSGFTLVEILIVVVILGILAAIVIPQFTGAATEAKLSSLVSDLQTMRSQIELYKLQHNEMLPSLTMEDFGGEQVNGLTGVTLVDGTQVAEGTDNSYGPYMQKMPTNQFNNSSEVDTSGTAGDSPSSGASATGWEYNTTTGEIYPDYIDLNGDGDSDDADEVETDY